MFLGDKRRPLVVIHEGVIAVPPRTAVKRRSDFVNQRYGVIVKFLISADSPEEAEELIESVCEKAATSVPEGDISYEGIEDIEEADDDE